MTYKMGDRDCASAHQHPTRSSQDNTYSSFQSTQTPPNAQLLRQLPCSVQHRSNDQLTYKTEYCQYIQLITAAGIKNHGTMNATTAMAPNSEAT